MIELWIPITVAAAFLQCVRTALQRRLKGALSTNGANFVRYLYGAPVALLLLAGLAAFGDAAIPAPNLRFLVMAAIGGVAQIAATSLLIIAFTLRNFAAGTTYSKTETVQTALLSTIVLAEPLTAMAWVAIGVSLVGVFVLSVPEGRGGLRTILFGWTERAALIGLGSGAMFGIAAVAIRGAALALDEGDFLGRAILTLAVITALQTVSMAAWLAWRERDQLAKVVLHWRPALLVGVLSVFGSAGWFAAMTLHNAAHVRALGQVELIFTVLVARFGFRERPTAVELVGIALVVGGVVTLLTHR